MSSTKPKEKYCDRCQEDKPDVTTVKVEDFRQTTYDLCRDCKDTV